MHVTILSISEKAVRFFICAQCIFMKKRNKNKAFGNTKKAVFAKKANLEKGTGSI